MDDHNEDHEDYDYDFPPTKYPGREALTFGLFVLVILTAIVWGGWKLIGLLW